MTAADEDKRQAASLIVTLSGSLTAGAVAVIGAGAALIAFVTDKYEVRWTFYAAMLIAFSLLAGGVYRGGQAVGQICHDGARGDWRNTPTQGSFNDQAIGALLGTLMLLIALVIGIASDRRSPESAATERVNAVEQRLLELDRRLDDAERLQTRMRAQIKDVRRRARNP